MFSHFPGMIAVDTTNSQLTRLTHSSGPARWFGRGSTFMLMVGKVLESFQRIGGGKIQPATRAEEAGAAAFGAFIHQCWPSDSSRRQLSQNRDPCKDCTLAVLGSQQNRKTTETEKIRRESP